MLAGWAAAAQHAPLSQQGISARPESLDAALSDLGLSPFPALVIGVEGATEYLLMPRVMELLGIQWDHNRIRIVDFGDTRPPRTGGTSASCCLIR